MDSPTGFELEVTLRPLEDPSFSAELTLTDAYRRHVRLPGRRGSGVFSGGVVLTLPDQATVCFKGTLRLNGPMLSDSSDNAFIVSCLHHFGLTSEANLSHVFRQINTVVQGQRIGSGGGGGGGGVVEVKIKKVRSRIFERNEDSEVDRFVRSWIRWYNNSSQRQNSDVTCSIQTVRYSQVCAICKEDYEDGEVISRLQCDHTFHGGCINPWLRINLECPLCRTRISGL